MLSSLKKKNKQGPTLEERENFQLDPLAPSEAINSYYFSAHDTLGTSLYCRLAWRGKGNAEVWWVYHDQNGDLYHNILANYDNPNVPIEVTCLKPGQEWKITFKDQVLDQGRKEQASVSCQMHFTATAPIFDFTTDLDPHLLANALVAEKWTKEWRAASQKHTQIHYEQLGWLDVDMKINNQPVQLHLPCLRDHSYGTREWGYMNQHIWLMALVNEHHCVNLNMVSYPHIKNLITGYCDKDGKLVQIKSGTPFQGFTVTGSVPSRFKYQLELSNGEVLQVEALNEFEVEFSFENNAYTICEGVATFLINGVKARGIAEFGYNQNPERWLSPHENH